MKTTFWFTSILLVMLIIPSSLSKADIRDRDGQTATKISFYREDYQKGEKVPTGQEPTPGPTVSLEYPYPIEPGTSTFGLILGAVIIVLTVVGGVIYASLSRGRN